MSEVDTAQLYAALDAARTAYGISWRELAEDIDLSASTFTRLQQGQQPSLDGYIVMCRWLGVPMETFTYWRTEKTSMFETELVALMYRKDFSEAEREFMLAASRALGDLQAKLAKTAID